MRPILDSKLPSNLQKMQRKYDNLLSTVYQGKIKSFLHQNKIVSFGEELSQIDNLLGQEIERDLNKLLEPHVFFTFSYLLLTDMARYYDMFQEIAASIPNNSDEYKSKLAHTIKTRMNIDMEEEQLKTFFQFIDQLTNIAVTLFVVYRDQIHFSSDVALLQLIQL